MNTDNRLQANRGNFKNSIFFIIVNQQVQRTNCCCGRRLHRRLTYFLLQIITVFGSDLDDTYTHHSMTITFSASRKNRSKVQSKTKKNSHFFAFQFEKVSFNSVFWWSFCFGIHHVRVRIQRCVYNVYAFNRFT